MGLLTIIRKNRMKEKEMRILFLWAGTGNVWLPPTFSCIPVDLTMLARLQYWRSWMVKISWPWVPLWDSTSKLSCIASKNQTPAAPPIHQLMCVPFNSDILWISVRHFCATRTIVIDHVMSLYKGTLGVSGLYDHIGATISNKLMP